MGLKMHFVLIGSCFEGQEHFQVAVEEMISSDNMLKAHVSLLGFQDNIDEWFSVFDIFTLPSKLPEPNATVVLAAMATGLPVIGTNIGGTVETIVDKVTGLLIPPRDSDMLCTQILHLVRRKEIREEMGRAGLERVGREFSLENYTRTIRKTYE